MSVRTGKIAELLAKEAKGTKILSGREQDQLRQLVERLDIDLSTARSTLTKIVHTTEKINYVTAEQVMFNSGGTVNLGGNTLTLAGNASVSGTNSGDETLAATSGLTLASHVLAVGAGDGIDVLTNSIAVDVTDLISTGLTEDGSNNIVVDQTFSPTWTGTHTFQDTLTTRDLLPETTDTYDIGSTTKMYRHGYLSELDAVLFAENTISLVGGWLMLCKDQGTLDNGDLTAGMTNYDFGEAMTVGDFIVLRGALKVEYIQIGVLESGTTYHLTRNLDGSGINDWAGGTPYAVFGQSGDGRIELNSGAGQKITICEQGADYNDQDVLLTIGDSGVNIVPSGTSVDKRAYTFASGATVYGGLYANYDEDKHSLELLAHDITGIKSDIKLIAESPATFQSVVALTATSGVGASASLGLYADSDASPTTWATLSASLGITGALTASGLVYTNTTGVLDIAAGITANIDAALTIATALTSNTGAGVLTWPAGGATLTIPATGTAALLGTANTFTNNNVIHKDVTDASLDLFYSYTYVTRATTANYTTYAGRIANYTIVNAGITASGASYGLSGGALRNSTAAGSDDDGTLAGLYGLNFVVGHLNTNASAAPITTEAQGIRLYLYNLTGTITNLSGITIKTNLSGGSGTNYYGVYIEDITGATNNYALFTSRGNVMFNGGYRPEADFQVNGDNYPLIQTDASDDELYLVNHASAKLSFFAATPIVQPANTVAIDTLLTNLGLRASGGTSNFATSLGVTGDSDVSGVYKVDGVQVVGNRVIDERIDDTVSSAGWGTSEANVVDAMRDAMLYHGLMAAA